MNAAAGPLDVVRDLLGSGAAYRLGWTLLHFTWQGLLIAAALALTLRAMRHRSPNARYIAACAALALTAVAPVVTFTLLPGPTPVAARPDRDPVAANTASESPARTTATAMELPRRTPPTDAGSPLPATTVGNSTPPAQRFTERFSTTLSPLLPWFVGAWALGVAVLSLWHLGGWLLLQRLKSTHTRPLGQAWDQRLANLCDRMRVTRPVRLLESALVQVPAVVGWLRPVILVPASAVSGLSARELEAILAHELAHVRRHDYLVNVLQSVVETLLFYHPAVWWVSQCVRDEREDCCDDAAADACGGELVYGRALAVMESLRTGPVPPRPALAAGSGGSLLRRIRRLAGRRDGVSVASPRPRGFSLAASATALAFVLLPLAALTLAAGGADDNKADATPATAKETKVLVIRGRVTDAETGKPIQKFRSVRAPFNPRGTPSPWQSHTVERHEGGRYELRLDRAWDQLRVRVDAEGYMPAVTQPVERAAGEVTADVELQPHPGFEGRVVTPDRQPVEGASVALATWTNEVNVTEGRLEFSTHGRKLGTIVKTKSDGSFVLPPDVDAGTVVIVHDKGYAAASPDDVRRGAVELQSWGTVRGRLLLGGKPTPGWTVAAGSIRPSGANYPYINVSGPRVTTDADGNFTIDKLAPGKFSVQLWVPGKEPQSWVAVRGAEAWVDVGPGVATELTLGGEGRPVVGRVVARGRRPQEVDFSKVKLRLILEAPHIGFPGDDAVWQAQHKFLTGDHGKLYTHDLRINDDGTFRIDRLPQGTYQLIGPVRGQLLPNARLTVDPMPGGKSDEPIDVGELEFSGQVPLRDGTGAAAAAARSEDSAPAKTEAELTEPQIQEIAGRDARMASLVGVRDKVKSELGEKRLRFTEQHPTVARLKALLDQADSRVQEYGKVARENERAAAEKEAEADAQYFLSGVPRPGVYRLGKRPVNLLQAVIAGGLDVQRTPGATVVLLRREPDGKRETATSLSVKELLDQRDKDVFLRADDIVMVRDADPAAAGAGVQRPQARAGSGAAVQQEIAVAAQGRQATELWQRIAQREDKALREKAVGEVVAMLKGDSSAKLGALAALRRCAEVKFDRKPLLQPVRDALRDASPAVRAMALVTLPTVGGDASDVEPVAALAVDPDEQVRVAVPTSLLFLVGQGKQPPDRVLKLDEKLLDDPSPPVRRETMRAMWGRPVSPAVEAKLVELSRSADTDTSHDAVYYALSTRPLVSKPVAERLIEVMRAPMTWGDSQGRAAWGLSHHNLSPEAKDVTLKALLAEVDETLNQYVRSNCVYGLGAIGGEEAVKKLKELTANDESEQVRKEAAQALARAGHKAE